MSFTITGPEITFAGKEVRSFFAEQIVFNIQCYDNNGGNIADYDESGSTTIINFNIAAGDLSANYPAGSVLYMYVESGSGYVGRAVVQSVSHTTATSVTLTTKVGMGTTSTIDADDFIFIITRDLFRYFKIQTAADSGDIIGPLGVTPNSLGVVKTDIGPLLRDYIRANDLDYVWYDFLFTEDVSGGYTTHSKSYMALDGYNGVGNTAGSSLGNWRLTSATDAVPPLTRFGNSLQTAFTQQQWNGELIYEFPRYWIRGWSENSEFYTYASFLIDELDLSDYTNVYARIYTMGSDKLIDISVSTNTYTNGAHDPQVVNIRLNLNFPVTQDERWLAVSLTGRSTITSKADLAAILYYQIVEEPVNPVCLKWRNSAGGWSYWVFGNMGIESVYNISKKGEYRTFSLDTLDTQDGNLKQLPNNEVQQIMTLREQELSEQQLRALHEIVSSPKVYCYLAKDGSDVIEVIPIAESFEYKGINTKPEFRRSFHREASVGNVLPQRQPSGLLNIEFKIKFPINFDFYKNKQYTDTGIDYT